MKKVSLGECFFKDIVFNTTTHRIYLLIDKIILICGCGINAISFFLYSITGVTFFHEVDFYLRLFNLLVFTGMYAIKHRVKVNELNFERELANIDLDSYSIKINEVEILPVNFKFYDDLPLNVINRIYKEGAYFILHTASNSYIFKVQEDEAYLVQEEDTLELEEINKLKLLR